MSVIPYLAMQQAAMHDEEKPLVRGRSGKTSGKPSRRGLPGNGEPAPQVEDDTIPEPEWTVYEYVYVVFVAAVGISTYFGSLLGLGTSTSTVSDVLRTSYNARFGFVFSVIFSEYFSLLRFLIFTQRASDYSGTKCGWTHVFGIIRMVAGFVLTVCAIGVAVVTTADDSTFHLVLSCLSAVSYLIGEVTVIAIRSHAIKKMDKRKKNYWRFVFRAVCVALEAASFIAVSACFIVFAVQHNVNSNSDPAVEWAAIAFMLVSSVWYLAD